MKPKQEINYHFTDYSIVTIDLIQNNRSRKVSAIQIIMEPDPQLVVYID